MISFAQNRRCNALQLNNTVRFFACGVSERVQEYLNYIGLASSRSTAISVLKSLAKESAKRIKTAMSLDTKCPIAPTMCIDNIDIEQRVHQSYVGNRSHTFRGTWGYVHMPNQNLLASLDSAELSLDAFRQALQKVSSLQLNMKMFFPTPTKEVVIMKIWKAQIGKVLNDYLAIPIDKLSSISTKPLIVDQISHKAPELYILKLMDVSDNSAEGIGQVF